jgi:hypothetical protein
VVAAFLVESCFMKSESLILASVLGACALFGVGTSKLVAPVTHSVETMFEEGAAESKTVTENSAVSLRESLAGHYPNAIITDEALDSLSCGEETSWLGHKDCFEGPTKEAKRYGKANVVMEEGKPPVYVQLVTMPAGAFLIK